MKTPLSIVVTSVAALAACAGLALAQSPMSLPSASTSAGQASQAANTSPSAVYAPSDIGASPWNLQDEHRPRGRRSGISSGTGTTSANSATNLPRLCFQPGTGWTTLPPAGFVPNDNSKGQPAQEGQPGANRGLVRRGISGMDMSRKAAECPPMFLPQSATTDTDADSSADNPASSFMNPSYKSNADLSQYDSFQTLLSPHSISGSGNSTQGKPSFDLPAGLKSSGLHDPTDPNSALEELRALRGRAYLSQVKIRRLSRNPQNMETRLEMRRMNTEVEKRNKKSKRNGEDQSTTAAKGNANGNKHVSSGDLRAKKAECDKKGNASKSKVCSILKMVM